MYECTCEITRFLCQRVDLTLPGGKTKAHLQPAVPRQHVHALRAIFTQDGLHVHVKAALGYLWQAAVFHLASGYPGWTRDDMLAELDRSITCLHRYAALAESVSTVGSYARVHALCIHMLSPQVK